MKKLFFLALMLICTTAFSQATLFGEDVSYHTYVKVRQTLVDSTGTGVDIDVFSNCSQTITEYTISIQALGSINSGPGGSLPGTVLGTFTTSDVTSTLNISNSTSIDVASAFSGSLAMPNIDLTSLPEDINLCVAVVDDCMQSPYTCNALYASYDPPTTTVTVNTNTIDFTNTEDCPTGDIQQHEFQVIALGTVEGVSGGSTAGTILGTFTTTSNSAPFNISNSTSVDVASAFSGNLMSPTIDPVDLPEDVSIRYRVTDDCSQLSSWSSANVQAEPANYTGICTCSDKENSIKGFVHFTHSNGYINLGCDGSNYELNVQIVDNIFAGSGPVNLIQIGGYTPALPLTAVAKSNAFPDVNLTVNATANTIEIPAQNINNIPMQAGIYEGTIEIRDQNGLGYDMGWIIGIETDATGRAMALKPNFGINSSGSCDVDIVGSSTSSIGSVAFPSNIPCGSEPPLSGTGPGWGASLLYVDSEYILDSNTPIPITGASILDSVDDLPLGNHTITYNVNFTQGQSSSTKLYVNANCN